MHDGSEQFMTMHVVVNLGLGLGDLCLGLGLGGIGPGLGGLDGLGLGRPWS